MRHPFACLAAVVLCLAAAPPAAAQAKSKIAVLDMKNDAGLATGILNTLNEILLNEFAESGKFEVLGSSDITSMISLEEQRLQLGGCVEDSCLAEVGGALGVDLMASARVGAVGTRYVVTVKILSVDEAKVKGRATEMVARDDDKLIAAVRKAVAKVVWGGPTGEEGQPLLGPPTAAPVTAEVESTPPPAEGVGFMDVAPWVALGLTVAAGGIGGALAGLAWQDAQAREDELQGTPDYQDLEESAETRALAADVLFGVAGAAAVATVVLFVIGAGDDEAPAAAAGVVPTRGGAAATLAIRFR